MYEQHYHSRGEHGLASSLLLNLILYCQGVGRRRAAAGSCCCICLSCYGRAAGGKATLLCLLNTMQQLRTVSADATAAITWSAAMMSLLQLLLACLL